MDISRPKLPRQNPAEAVFFPHGAFPGWFIAEGAESAEWEEARPILNAQFSILNSQVKKQQELPTPNKQGTTRADGAF